MKVINTSTLQYFKSKLSMLIDAKADISHTHTKAQIGLGNVDNTSDADKPISTATQTALGGKAAASHSHSKAQIGLGSVDNTSDADKPISTATQTALNAKAAASDLTAHTGNTTAHITSSERTAWNAKQNALTFDDVPTANSTNPVKSGGVKTALDAKAAASHTHTNAQVGLANVDNTSDANKPISTATQTALDGKAAASHTHTKSQVGLGNVDNTSDANKPISTETRTALNGKADRGVFEINDVNFNAHVRIEDNEYRYTLYDIPDKADVIVLNDARINTQGIGRIVGAIEYVNGKTIKVLNAGDSMTIATVESEYYTSNEGAIHGYGGLNINSYSFGKFRFIDFVYWNGGWYSPVYDYSPA